MVKLMHSHGKETQSITLFTCFLLLKYIFQAVKWKVIKTFHQPLGYCQKVFMIFKDIYVSKFEWVRNPFTSNIVFRLTSCEQE